MSFKNKSPIRSVFGFLTLFVLTACQAPKTPIETTRVFWSSIVENKLDNAQKFCSSSSEKLRATLGTDLKGFTLGYGKIVIDGNLSSVETTLFSSSTQQSTFTTFMLLEEDIWKVDCQRSTTALAGNQVFKDFFNSLNTLGEQINKKLEQQIPLIEKEITSFGEELQQQLDNFGDNIEKSFPQDQQKPPQNTI